LWYFVTFCWTFVFWTVVKSIYKCVSDLYQLYSMVIHTWSLKNIITMKVQNYHTLKQNTGKYNAKYRAIYIGSSRYFAWRFYSVLLESNLPKAISYVYQCFHFFRRDLSSISEEVVHELGATVGPEVGVLEEGDLVLVRFAHHIRNARQKHI